MIKSKMAFLVHVEYSKASLCGFVVTRAVCFEMNYPQPAFYRRIHLTLLIALRFLSGHADGLFV